MRNRTWRTLAVVAVLSMAACGVTAAERVDPATPSGAPVTRAGTLGTGALEPPAGRIVLTVTGAITGGNDGDRVSLDLALLERMPSLEATIHEPFIGQDVRFDGVLLSDLLRIVGAQEDASVLSMTALDDYHVRLPLEQLDTDRTLLAFAADGHPIEIADGGPTRIVFLDQTGLAANTDNWIWSVSDIVVQA